MKDSVATCCTPVRVGHFVEYLSRDRVGVARRAVKGTSLSSRVTKTSHLLAPAILSKHGCASGHQGVKQRHVERQTPSEKKAVKQRAHAGLKRYQQISSEPGDHRGTVIKRRFDEGAHEFRDLDLLNEGLFPLLFPRCYDFRPGHRCVSQDTREGQEVVQHAQQQPPSRSVRAVMKKI